MMDYYMKATIIFCLLSLATASAPSQQDVLIDLMHQYCINQVNQTSTGPPGIVNYTAIEEKIAAKYLDLDARIDEKFKRSEGIVVTGLKTCDTKIEKIRNEMKECICIEKNGKDSNPTTRIPTTMTTTPQSPPSCPMWIGGSCFTLVNDKYYNRVEAVEVCSQRSSHLADITSKSTFDMLMNRIRSDYLGGSSHIDMHLGMTITPSTGQVALSDGRNAPYVKWYPGYPGTSFSNTAMALQVNTDRMRSDQYFWNYPTTVRYYRLYALCQMND